MNPTGKLKQGLHADPLDPACPRPDPSTWSPRRRTAFESPMMALYRDALRLPHVHGVREAVLDDLGTYHGLSPKECVERCLHWEEWSVEEWKGHERVTPEDIADFYHSTKSWSFDLLWYAYLQAEGYAYPVSVAIAQTLGPPDGRQLSHLDFGSGIGATSQLFRRLGWETTLADISTSLQEFARFRLQRRGETATFLDLNAQELEPERYDVITAVDTLVHIPDLPAALVALHRALKPGGQLFANLDTRPATPENAWHLYADDLQLRWQMHRAGFEPVDRMDHMAPRYRKVDPAELAHLVRGCRDYVLLKSPLRPLYRSVKQRVKAVIG